MHAPRPDIAAIDFGISNTDAVVRQNGDLRVWSEPYQGDPDQASIRSLLEREHIVLDALPQLVVTGGRHRVLPEHFGDTALIKVNEVEAIGRGGQAVLSLSDAERGSPLLVVSAGSGTAMIKAQGSSYAHVSGTGVGGGTMLGFARLLLGTVDPAEIGTLAELGNRNGADLSLADVITGPIGSLPADATAVNFGRLGRRTFDGQVSRPDLAAALVNLVSQTIALMATNVARAHNCDRIVMVGHMLDMKYARRVIGLVANYYGTTFEFPEHAGSATALGALLLASEAPSQLR